MNGKKAKALRRIARQQTPDQPERDYKDSATGAVLVDAITTRGVLKFFKREIEAGRFKLNKGA
jgi:hypothetical protein